MPKIKTTVEIADDRIHNLMVSALEGGIGYWANRGKLVFPKGTTRADFEDGGKFALKDGNSDWGVFYSVLFHPQGGVMIHDGACEDDPDFQPIRWHIGLAEKGLQVLADKYPAVFSDILNENDDASTADCFVQCCLFGKIVFG